MQTVNYVFYSDYLKNRKVPKNSILVSKTKNSVLIGPKIDDKFDEFSFYKRLLSTSIYDINMYKKMLMKNTNKFIKKYYMQLESNEVIEVYKKRKILKHKIISVPGCEYEKE